MSDKQTLTAAGARTGTGAGAGAGAAHGSLLEPGELLFDGGLLFTGCLPAYLSQGKYGDSEGKGRNKEGRTLSAGVAYFFLRPAINCFSRPFHFARTCP